MARIVRGRRDKDVKALLGALAEYESQFAGAEASLYRQNSGSIRVRVVDERFAGVPRSRRHDDVWRFIHRRVGDDIMSQVSVLLAFPKSELASSLANQEFEDPVTTGS